MLIPAQAAIFIAAKRPVFHTGERQSLGDAGALRMATAEIRQHVSTAGSLTPSCGFAAQRPRFASPFFRSSSLLSMPVRLALLGNGHGPCGAAVWSAPPPCRIIMRRGGVAPYALTLAPPAVKEMFNTILQWDILT